MPTPCRSRARIPQTAGWSRAGLRTVFAVALFASLSACEDRDPYRRTDVWKPTGANAANIATMAADPQDLIRGRPTSRVDARSVMHGPERIWADQPRSLGGGGSYSGSSIASPGAGSQ